MAEKWIFTFNNLSTIESFWCTIELVQTMHFGNQLLSDLANIVIEANKYGHHCSCALSRSCRSSMAIYNLSRVL